MEHVVRRLSAPRPRRRLLRATAWLYVGGLAAVWGIIHWGGDRWWLATVAMFGPKWIYAVPLPVLAVVALLRAGRRGPWAALAIAAVLVTFPIGRLCIPWRTWLGGARPNLTVLTCNTGHERCDTSRLAALIADVKPDIVCLQEFRGETEPLFNSQWRVFRSGDIVVATREPAARIDVVKRAMPKRWPRPICQIVRIDRSSGPFFLAAVHCLSPRHGLAAVTDARTILAPSRQSVLVEQTFNRRSEHQRLRARLRELEGPLLVVGDFNVPTTSTIYRQCWAHLQNAFTEAGWGWGYTVNIQQGGLAFSARVDHVLADDSWRVAECWQGPDGISDHRPVIARLSTR